MAILPVPMHLPRPSVTFDLWHTLLYLAPEDEEGYMRRQVDEAVAVLESSEVARGAARAPVPELRAGFEREYALAVDAAGEGRSVTPAEQLTRAALAVGRVPHPERYTEALERTLRSTPFRVSAGTIPVLRDLRVAGYSLGVISNTVGEPGRFLRPILHRMGFDEVVETWTFSDEGPWTKPAPEIFQKALEGLGSAPSNAVHVGDGWSDIEGARRAGLRGAVLFTGLQEYGERYRELFLPHGWADPRAKHRVSRLADVVPIVHRLLPLDGAAGR
jgi:HAD superfamily hydrolase (TIGR01549 family)